MIRVLKSLPTGKSASRRSLTGDDSTAAQMSGRPRLSVVGTSHFQHLPPYRGMWDGEPVYDATMLTNLEDWPTQDDFEPLIAGALAAGDSALVALLEQDRDYCSAARARLSRPRLVTRDFTA